MDNKESIKSQEFTLAEKANPHQDVRSLWDRWDKAQQEEGPCDLVKGYNLVGVVMITMGAVFQTFGNGILRDVIAPISLLTGAVILGVRKFRTLWQQRSLDS